MIFNHSILKNIFMDYLKIYKRSKIWKRTRPIKKNNNHIFLYLQAIFSLITVVLTIVYILNKSITGFLQLSLGLTILIMGYNNYKVYHRKFLTLVYILVGVILITLSVITFLGV